MGTSLESRLNGNKADFLRDIKIHGDWAALDLWKEKLEGYSSYTGLRKFILEQTGDANYGLNPVAASPKGAFREFISAWSEFYLNLTNENKRLREENEVLKREFKIRETEEISLIMPLLEEMKKA